MKDGKKTEIEPEGIWAQGFHRRYWGTRPKWTYAVTLLLTIGSITRPLLLLGLDMDDEPYREIALYLSIGYLLCSTALFVTFLSYILRRWPTWDMQLAILVWILVWALDRSSRFVG